MTSRTGFRIAATIFLLFAAGHTFGFLSFRPATPEAQAVWNAMQSVRFGGTAADVPRFSYGGFYIGFGLTITAFLLFQGWLSWVCGEMASKGLSEGRSIGLALALLQVVGGVVSLKFFSMGPAIFSGMLALLLGFCALRSPVRE
jgi:hypothetical protein